MRLIGTIENQKLAHRFSAWLKAEGVENQLEAEGQEFQIWVKDEDQLQRAVSELATFQANPNQAVYLEAVPRAEKLEREAAERRRAYEKNVIKNKPASGGGRSPLTVTLIVIAAAVALLTSFGAEMNNVWFETLTFTDAPLQKVVESRALETAAYTETWLKFWSVSRGEIWRMITPIFIHFGTLHLVFNMIWLFQLGRLIEFRYGTPGLAWLVLASAALSNIVQMGVPFDWGGLRLGVNANGHIVAGLGGMSGVVYALFGFVWIKSLIDPLSRFFLPQTTVILMLGWLVFCMLPVSQGYLETRSVANWAHGAGLAVGVLAAYLTTGLGSRGKRVA